MRPVVVTYGYLSGDKSREKERGLAKKDNAGKNNHGDGRSRDSCSLSPLCSRRLSSPRRRRLLVTLQSILVVVLVCLSSPPPPRHAAARSCRWCLFWPRGVRCHCCVCRVFPVLHVSHAIAANANSQRGSLPIRSNFGRWAADNWGDVVGHVPQRRRRTRRYPPESKVHMKRKAQGKKPVGMGEWR
ncbi:hypothetical protein BZA05DRAFT_436704, partial [Tricharina praecox]|uniref:uncharacterized protein n=1 Tax=Tricharina praecox TaxID=43433 RepID=UPI002220A187